MSGLRALACAGLLAGAAAWAGGCSQGRERLAAGPYVQHVTSSSAVVAAITDAPERLVLRFGPDEEGAALDGEVREAEAVLVHGLEAAGLSPATSYRYVLEHESGAALGGATFHTAPGPEGDRVTFLALGDSGGTDDDDGPLDAAEGVIDDVRGTGGDENQQKKVVTAMLGTTPDLVLHTGDVVYPSGAREDYPEGFFRPFAPLISQVPLFPTLGNHDVKTQGGAPYLENFFLPDNGVQPDGRTYSFDWANVHFTCLDVMTTPYDEGSPQLAWLDHDLGATDRTWKVVWFHVPAVSASRSGGSESLQRTVVPLLEKHGVDLCLSGHDHVYARFFPVGPVTYVTTGGGGKSLYAVRDDPGLAYAESVFHFLEVTVEGREMRLRAIDAGGSAFDAVTIRKPGG